MLSKTQRQAEIVAELHANPMVRISDLAVRFDVTTETIRRDIAALQERGLVNRVHGGATAAAQIRSAIGPVPMSGEAESDDPALARLALAEVRDGDTVMVEAGGAMPELARWLSLERNDLTVITNGIWIAHQMARNASHEVVLCPGGYRVDERAVYGADTVLYLQRFSADVGFVAADGLVAEGAQADRRCAAATRRLVLERSRRAVAVVRGGDLGRSGLETFAPLSGVDRLVVGADLPAELATAVEGHGIEVSYPARIRQEISASGSSSVA